MNPGVAAVGDVLVDVVRGGVAGVSQRDAILGGDAANGGEVGDAVGGGVSVSVVAKPSENALVGNAPAADAKLDYVGDVRRGDVGEEKPAAGSGQANVDERLGVADAETADLVDAGGRAARVELAPNGVQDFERAGGLSAHGGSDADPRVGSVGELSPALVGGLL